ncbi:hypothetical protein [Streptomyces salinarius]|uniref:hypothetical protein n=1 Tax=Streptomyces salinarius TaxID=2762598 RepID=UPI0016443C23|nr:hypothetical protein [Streptomyces salinarius]
MKRKMYKIRLDSGPCVYRWADAPAFDGSAGRAKRNGEWLEGYYLNAYWKTPRCRHESWEECPGHRPYLVHGKFFEGVEIVATFESKGEAMADRLKDLAGQEG